MQNGLGTEDDRDTAARIVAEHRNLWQEAWRNGGPLMGQVNALHAAIYRALRDARQAGREESARLLDQAHNARDRAERRVRAYEQVLVLTGPTAPYAVRDSDPIEEPTPETLARLLDERVPR